MDVNKTLLIVEDDAGLQSQLKWAFDGFEVVTASNRSEALKQLRRYEPSVVTLDLGLPPDPDGATEGLATLKEILELAPSTRVIMVTGNEDRENAVTAIGLGAYDFYQKPVDPEMLALIVDRAFHVHQLEQENKSLNEGSISPLDGLIAISPQMLKVSRMIEKVAPADVSVLLLGESGTGKEVLAKAVHNLSAVNGGPFIAINCAAIPENLLESELFGHEKGAFTGATKMTIGKIETATGGTLFLDEIGDLPLPLQSKLLRFLQERVIERVGGRKEIPVDVRIICATHQNVQGMIDEGSFREDLYYRISEMVVKIPALRERDGDAPILAKFFLNKFAAQQKKSAKGFSQEAIEKLAHYAWPGNVRELENRVKRALIMADGALITAEDLDMEDVVSEAEPLNLREVRENAERHAIMRALVLSDYNISQTSSLLGVSRPTLYDLMKKFGISNQKDTVNEQ